MKPEEPHSTPTHTIDSEAGLRKALSTAQVVMIGLGGAIGTGLFMGSGIAIGYAGPAVLVSFAIAGFVGLVMVFSLSEMAVAYPTAGSFGVYAETYLNPWAGFVVRYTYWLAQTIAVGGESIAAGLYMNFWFPDVPVWMWSIGFAFIVLYANARSVSNFGTIEYWFAMIKVAAIILFIILGLASILGMGLPATGFHNLTTLPGGFAPNGFHGIWLAVIMGIFSFNGIEIIAVTSGEVADPARAIPAALRTMIFRLFLFYIVALAIVVTVIPWTESGAKVVEQSPFVRVFASAGIPYGAGIMNFVVLSAALSSMNTNLYTCSRMLFSLSRGGYAPRFLGRLGRKSTPIGAIFISGTCIFATAVVSKLTPNAYRLLLGVSLFGSIIVWIIILFSHLSYRRSDDVADLVVHMPWFPWMQLAGIALLVAVLVTMGLDDDWSTSWKCGVPWLALLSTVYFIGRAGPFA